MKERIRTYADFSSALGDVETLIESYAAIYDQPYINSDGRIHMEVLEKLERDCFNECGADCVWRYYFGIRQRGVEGAERFEPVCTRIKDLNDICLATIMVDYNGQSYDVTHTRLI